MVIGLLAATSILALAGCNSGHHKASGGQRASKSSQEPAVYATDAISPDGKRMAVVRHTSKGEYLEIGPLAVTVPGRGSTAPPTTSTPTSTGPRPT